MTRYWKVDKKMMGYAILAYFIGMIAGSIIAGLIALFHPLPLLPFLGVALPVFIGSVLAGFLAQHRGMLIAFILTLLIVSMHYIMSNARYPTSFTVTRAIVGLLTSMVAGYLGLFLAQKWHKRTEQNVDVSQGEH